MIKIKEKLPVKIFLNETCDYLIMYPYNNEDEMKSDLYINEEKQYFLLPVLRLEKTNHGYNLLPIFVNYLNYIGLNEIVREKVSPMFSEDHLDYYLARFKKLYNVEPSHIIYCELLNYSSDYVNGVIDFHGIGFATIYLNEDIF